MADTMKMPTLVFFSLVATLLLFSLMKALITNDTLTIPLTTKPQIVDIVMPKEVIKTLTPVEPLQPPQLIIHPEIIAVEPVKPGGVIESGVLQPKIPIIKDNTTTLNIINTAMHPWIRTEPQYPPRAARRGLEGWCIVRFTLEKSVENSINW